MSADTTRGRFAPSPTGSLHLGNLRTALVAWLSARHAGGDFVVRMEDLDRVTSLVEHERQQLAELRDLGLDWDGPVVRQSDRFDLHRDAIAQLQRAGLLFECYCTRREIREAAQAPHGPGEGRYPGTCRELSDRDRQRLQNDGRRPALRLRGHRDPVAFVDRIVGPSSGEVDDVVVQRNDGVPAYNLAVVVDDAAQGINEVVRGDDLLAVTPPQIELQQHLGLPRPTYAHVPLVLAPDGARLAKRHGAVTLGDLAARGIDAAAVRRRLLDSLGIDARLVDTATSLADIAASFELNSVPRRPWQLTTADL